MKRASLAETILKAAHSFQRFNEAWERSRNEDRRRKELNDLKRREGRRGE